MKKMNEQNTGVLTFLGYSVG